MMKDGVLLLDPKCTGTQDVVHQWMLTRRVELRMAIAILKTMRCSRTSHAAPLLENKVLKLKPKRIWNQCERLNRIALCLTNTPAQHPGIALRSLDTDPPSAVLLMAKSKDTSDAKSVKSVKGRSIKLQPGPFGGPPRPRSTLGSRESPKLMCSKWFRILGQISPVCNFIRTLLHDTFNPGQRTFPSRS